MQIQKAVQEIVDLANLRSKEDLDIWCQGRGRQKLYEYVKRFAPEHWEQIHTPKNSVRFYYQQILTGYKISKNRV